MSQFTGIDLAVLAVYFIGTVGWEILPKVPKKTPGVFIFPVLFKSAKYILRYRKHAIVSESDSESDEEAYIQDNDPSEQSKIIQLHPDVINQLRSYITTIRQ